MAKDNPLISETQTAAATPPPVGVTEDVDAKLNELLERHGIASNASLPDQGRVSGRARGGRRKTPAYAEGLGRIISANITIVTAFMTPSGLSEDQRGEVRAAMRDCVAESTGMLVEKYAGDFQYFEEVYFGLSIVAIVLLYAHDSYRSRSRGHGQDVSSEKDSNAKVSENGAASSG